jgi:hypothetical protein
VPITIVWVLVAGCLVYFDIVGPGKV